MPVSLDPAYPVWVRGELDSNLSRWRWLVKWFLAIPHIVVLAFLWIAFLFASIGAWVSIVFTGRYPRRIFDFNVGVMRWTWRVHFYAFTLATDRYPPFSLKPDPSYPADLDVEYSERLSRGLVWVKWWLLAIPHFFVIAIFGGTQMSGGLIAVLACIAGFFLLFKQRYPTSIFDFIMGMHRWTIRVIAYAALMRDEYPPFRLDNGPHEPPPPTEEAVEPLAA